MSDPGCCKEGEVCTDKPNCEAVVEPATETVEAPAPDAEAEKTE